MNIKQYIMLISITLFSCMSLHAKNIVLEFSPEDFRLNYDESGVLSVVSDNLKSFYSEEVEYALPSFMYETELVTTQVPSLRIQNYRDTTLYTSVKLGSKPMLFSVGEENDSKKNVSYANNTYCSSKSPEICKVVGYSILRNGKMRVNLVVFPFVYNEEGSLRLVTDIEIELSETMNYKNPVSRLNEDKLSKYKSLLNDYLLGESKTYESSVNKTTKDINNYLRRSASRWDYLILTSSELYDSFMVLADWKDLKGVSSIVLKVEELLEAASIMGDSPEERLKWYIMALEDMYSIQYVLLGGDETIIPVKKCYGAVTGVGGKSANDIPADLFYGCFGGSLNWDGNNNGICGELDDDVDLYANLYVTRVPVRTKADADAFVNKLLKYEQNPEIHKAILMCGGALDSSTFSSPSDADRKGRSLWGNHISKVWDGGLTRLYDTSTSFPGNADYQFNVSNFMDEFEKGYSFLDMITAGDYNYWTLEGGPFMFLHANRQANTGSTFVISASNNCNAFEKSASNLGIDQSISEFLINNPNNGVVGFLGSSRENWEYEDFSDLGPNLKYNAWFYRYLFAGANEEKNFGRIVNSAKSTVATAAYDSYGPYRWLQFALNPIGDPETPVFISTPKEFSKAGFKRLENGKIQVYSGETSCRLCIKSMEDEGKSCYKVLNNISNLGDVDMYRETSICFTKSEYIPRYFLIYNFQNQTIMNRTLKGDLVRMGSNVLSKFGKGKVSFKGSVKISSPLVEVLPGTEVPKGARVEITN